MTRRESGLPSRQRFHGSDRPIATFLTDFGLEDPYVGIVKGVMLGLCPELIVVDLTHAVPPQDIFEGAFQLMTAIPYFPPGCLHLAVVDPGVGTARRAVAVRLAGQTLVGPDNGVLSLALVRLARQEGLRVDAGDGRLAVKPPLEAVELAEPRFWRHPVSTTFHARDIFGPAVAHLARGIALDALGPPVMDLVALPFPVPRQEPGRVTGQVLHVDRFGNLITSIPGEMLGPDAVVRAGPVTIAGLRPTYGAGTEPVALVGSSGLLEIALPSDSAARCLRLGRGDTVVVDLPRQE